MFTWSALFALGILGYLYQSGLIPLRGFVPLTISAVVIHAYVPGWENGLVGLITLATILYLPAIQSRLLIWIGTLTPLPFRKREVPELLSSFSP